MSGEIVTYKNLVEVLERYLSKRGMGRKLGLKKGESDHIRAIQHIISLHAKTELKRAGSIYSAEDWSKMSRPVSTDAWQDIKRIAQIAAGTDSVLNPDLARPKELTKLEKANFNPINPSPRTATALIEIFDLYKKVYQGEAFAEGTEWFGLGYAVMPHSRTIAGQQKTRDGHMKMSTTSDGTAMSFSSDMSGNDYGSISDNLGRQMEFFESVKIDDPDALLDALDEEFMIQPTRLQDKLMHIQASLAQFTKTPERPHTSQEISNIIFSKPSPATQLPFVLPQFANFPEALEDYVDERAFNVFLKRTFPSTDLNALTTEQLKPTFEKFLAQNTHFIKADGKDPSADILRKFAIAPDGSLMRKNEAPEGSKELIAYPVEDGSAEISVDKKHLQACIGFLKLQDPDLLQNLDINTLSDNPSEDPSEHQELEYFKGALADIQKLAELPPYLLQPKYTPWINNLCKKDLTTYVLNAMNSLAQRGVRLHLLQSFWFTEDNIQLLEKLNSTFAQSAQIVGLNDISSGALKAHIADINHLVHNPSDFFDGIAPNRYFQAIELMHQHAYSKEQMRNKTFVKSLCTLDHEALQNFFLRPDPYTSATTRHSDSSDDEMAASNGSSTSYDSNTSPMSSGEMLEALRAMEADTRDIHKQVAKPSRTQTSRRGRLGPKGTSADGPRKPLTTILTR